jgi:hypothetical protein
MSTRIGHERGLLCRRMDVVVVGELGEREEFVPIILSLIDE